MTGYVHNWTNERTVSTTDLIGAMFGGELELALLQVDAPDLVGFVHHCTNERTVSTTELMTGLCPPLN